LLWIFGKNIPILTRNLKTSNQLTFFLNMNKTFTKIKCTVLAAAAFSAFCAVPALAQTNLDYKAASGVNAAGTYTDLGTTGTAITVANTDDANSAVQQIGFTFNFNNTNFTEFTLNTNGFIKLGATAISSTGPQVNIYGTTFPDLNIIAPLAGVDLQGAANQTTNPTEFRVFTTGTTPNRVTTIQFENQSDKASGTGTATTPSQFATLNYQIKLYEGTNDIEFVYGTWTASANAAAAQIFTIGLKGSTGGANDRLGMGNLPATGTSLTPLPWPQTRFETTTTFNGTGYIPTFIGANAALPDAGRTFRFVKFNAPANDLSVEAIYSLGKMPLLAAGNSNEIKAVIKNTGSTTMTNVPVTLAVTGGTAFNPAPVTIATLAPNASTTVVFPVYTAATTGTKTATVTLPTDAVASNNTKTTTFDATASTFGYAVGTTRDGSVGFGTTGNAAFLNKHTVVGTMPIRVATVRAYVGPDVNAVGKTVFGVIVNSTGTEVGRSANKVLASGDLDGFVTFTITTPPTFTNETFYVGMAQPTYTGTQYFPMGFQNETPTRPDGFYTWGVGSTTAPTASTAGRRFMIEADIQAVTGVKEDLNSKLVSVFPNPSNGIFKISANELKGNSLKFEVRDLQGKLVHTANGPKENATLNLSNIASGVYMLTVSTEVELTVKRIVVE
jgi:hypothetical protein